MDVEEYGGRGPFVIPRKLGLKTERSTERGGENKSQG